MSEQLVTATVTVLTALAGVAIIAVIVSKNAQTPQVIQSGFSGFSQALGVAVSPVTGSGGGITGLGGVGFPNMAS